MAKRFLFVAIAVVLIGAADPPLRLDTGTTLKLGADSRLKAVGLDPKSASFAADVDARLKAGRSALEGVHPASTRALIAPRFRGLSHTRVLSHTLRAGASSTTSLSESASISSASRIRAAGGLGTLATAKPAGAGSTTFSGSSQFARENATIHNLLNPGFTFEQFDDFLSGDPITTRPLPIPGGYIMVVGSSTPNLPEPGYGPYTASIPDCNVSKTFQYGRLWDPTNKNPSDNYYGWKLPSAIAGTSFYDLNLDLYRSNNDPPPFPIGVKPHAMNVSAQSEGRTITQSVMVTNVDSQETSNVDTIDENGHLARDSGVGLTAANVQGGGPGVRRVNTGQSRITGTDIVGRGITLGAGVTATAKIVAAHSIADTPSDTSPDNGYRGATVTTPPAGGRLETIVTWYVQPGDSLQYDIQWTFVGAPGQRSTLSMPLQGPCDS